MHFQNKWPSKDGIRISHININHAINKLDDISHLLYNYGNPLHVLGITEAHISDNIDTKEIHMAGYNEPICRRPKRPLETGILLYVNETVQFKRLHHLENLGIECIWIEISIPKAKPIIIGYVYRNGKELVSWQDTFCNMIDEIVKRGNDYFILGDFNINLLVPQNTWMERVEICNLEQLIKTPTRTTEGTETLIDHLYVSNKEHIIETCVSINGCSDHFPISFTWRKAGIKIPKPGHKTITYRSFKKFNKDVFLYELYHSNLELVYTFTDPELAIHFWYKNFIAIYDKNAPLTTKRVKHYQKPEWYDDEYQKEVYQRDYLKRVKRETEFKIKRNEVTALKRRKRIAFYTSLTENKKKSNLIWKAINKLTNKKIKPSKTICIPADKLNDHFANIAEKTITEDKSDVNDLLKLKEFTKRKNVDNDLNIPYLTVSEVHNYLCTLKDSNARGLDGLDNKILKIAAPIIAESLTYIYNLCIQNAYFPSLLKSAKIFPIFKSGDASDPSNYRPISILSSLSKPLEKHINLYILNHLNKYNLLHDSQSGFRESRSCHTALVTMVDDWLKNINDSKLCGALFIDFAKAFDVIDHNLLLRKLEHYHLSNSTIKLIESFLTGRTQQVCINKHISTPEKVKFGVPQGSVLGPLLFSIYINDLPLYLSCSCELFADDTTLYQCDRDLTNLSDSLQTSANELENWTKSNHMAINTIKTKAMLITTRQKRQNLQSSFDKIMLQNKTISEVSEHKVLGVTIDNNLSWAKHISNTSKMLSKKIYQLARIKKFIGPHARKMFFAAHILPYFDYSSTLWDSACANTFKLLTRLFKRALKLVLAKRKIYEIDYYQAKILSLKDRLFLNKLAFVHKILKGNSSNTLQSMFTQKQREPSKIVTPTPFLPHEGHLRSPIY